MQAALYVRVSTEEQAEKGYSLASQGNMAHSRVSRRSNGMDGTYVNTLTYRG